MELHQAHKDRLARMDAAAVEAKEQAVKQPMMLAQIQKAVARHYFVSMSDLLSSRKPSRIAGPRQVAMYLCKKLTSRSLPEIGRSFRKDHTTVLHAINKITERLKTEENLADDVNSLILQLQEEYSDEDFRALETEVTQVCRAAWLNARELEGYRRHGGARRYLKSPEMLDDIEKARDYLSRVLDDMRGVK
jgi:hypothetical protein